jgi:hypothetical protein
MKFNEVFRSQKRKLKIILNEGQVRRLTNSLITDSLSKVKSR